jgi:4-hydroxy-3-methylbut-2-enyl diphosphate reductase IspH
MARERILKFELPVDPSTWNVSKGVHKLGICETEEGYTILFLGENRDSEVTAISNQYPECVVQAHSMKEAKEQFKSLVEHKKSYPI